MSGFPLVPCEMVFGLWSAPVCCLRREYVSCVRLYVLRVVVACLSLSLFCAGRTAQYDRARSAAEKVVSQILQGEHPSLKLLDGGSALGGSNGLASPGAGGSRRSSSCAGVVRGVERDTVCACACVSACVCVCRSVALFDC